MQIAAERALAAIKEAIGEVLQGEEPALLEGFVADAHEAMAAQGGDAALCPGD